MEKVQNKMSYGSIMKRLQRLEFPDCTREALEFITETFSSQEGAAIPGLGGDKEPILAEVCQAFVLFGSKRSTKVKFVKINFKIINL